MTGFENIKTFLSGNNRNGEDLTWPETGQDTSLKQAMAEVERKETLSEEIKQIALDYEDKDYLEDLTAEKLGEELSSVDLDFEKPISAFTPEAKSPEYKANLTAAMASKRVHELQRRQTSVEEMRDQLARTDMIIKALTKKSDQLFDYLSKAKVEISELEDTEKKYQSLHAESEKLKSEHKELQSKLEEKYDEVLQLESVKQKNRDSLEQAHIKINQMSEKLEEQSSEIQAIDAKYTKASDDQVAIKEKYDLLMVENDSFRQKNSDLGNKLAVIEQRFTEQEKAFSRTRLELSNTTAELEQSQLNANDIQDRYNKLSEEYSALKSSHDESLFDLEAEKRGSEEKVRLKNARIMKLERSIEVLNRQLAIAENLLGNAHYDSALASLKKRKEAIDAKHCNEKPAHNGQSADAFLSSVTA
ncbi:MAG: hypothetical protein QNJ29_09990 [Rhizobiaceae bacterium]|nr:hypothetical protein [Rhizobiaceae bacterium]